MTTNDNRQQLSALVEQSRRDSESNARFTFSTWRNNAQSNKPSNASGLTFEKVQEAYERLKQLRDGQKIKLELRDDEGLK